MEGSVFRHQDLLSLAEYCSCRYDWSNPLPLSSISTIFVPNPESVACLISTLQSSAFCGKSSHLNWSTCPTESVLVQTIKNPWSLTSRTMHGNHSGSPKFSVPRWLTAMRNSARRSLFFMGSSEIVRRARKVGFDYIQSRHVLIPGSDPTRGHGTTGNAALWKQHLADLLQRASRTGK